MISVPGEGDHQRGVVNQHELEKTGQNNDDDTKAWNNIQPSSSSSSVWPDDYITSYLFGNLQIL